MFCETIIKACIFGNLMSYFSSRNTNLSILDSKKNWQVGDCQFVKIKYYFKRYLITIERNDSFEGGQTH